MLLVSSGRLISITSTPATPLGMPVSINRNTQRIDDPRVNISRPVISMPAKFHQYLDPPRSSADFRDQEV